MKFVLVLGLIAAILSGGSAVAGARDTGLYGRVVIYPAYPVCMEGAPCSRPAGGFVLRFSRNGHVVASVKTRSDGSFRLALEPGLYAVGTPSPKAMGPRLDPKTARVPKARYGRENFTVDIGIR